MTTDLIERMRMVPSYRGLIQPIEEAAGPLLLVRDLLEDEPFERVLQLIDLGLPVYAAGETLFVSKGDLHLYDEMLEGIVNPEIDDDGEDDCGAEGGLGNPDTAA